VNNLISSCFEVVISCSKSKISPTSKTFDMSDYPRLSLITGTPIDLNFSFAFDRINIYQPVFVSLLIRAARQVGSEDFSLYGKEMNGSIWALCNMFFYFIVYLHKN
jgi:hypothetical protein